MNNLTESVVTVMVAVIGLASLAVIVSRNSRTTDIVNAGGSQFNNWLTTAISPVMGNGGYNMTTGGVFG